MATLSKVFLVGLSLAACASHAQTGSSGNQSSDAQKATDAAVRAEAAALEAKEAAKKANLAAARSGDDFTGDTITLQTHTPGFTLVRTDTPNFVAMAGTVLRVMRDEKGMLLVSVLKVPCIAPAPERAPEKLAPVSNLFARKLTGDWSCAPPEGVNSRQLVVRGESYEIDKGHIPNFGFIRSGLVYGLLLVPYKYHRHDSSFGSSITIGPYIGSRVGLFGTDTSLIFSVGLSSLNVPNGSGGVSTQQGYTVAAGIIWSVTKNNSPLQFGILVGKDWAGSNSTVPYKHEGKTWIAAQVGFNFSD